MPGHRSNLGFVIVVAVVFAAMAVPAPATADIESPCRGGTALNVFHAYPECRTNDAGEDVWFVVTDAYYRCPPAGAVQAFRVEETETSQPCDDPAPGQDDLVRELGPGDLSAQEDGEFVFLECISGFWYRVTYQRHRLPDGGIRISTPAKNLENTNVPCDEDRPPLFAGLPDPTPGEDVAAPIPAEPIADRPGRLTGVVVASRRDRQQQSTLLVAAPSRYDGEPVDRIRLEVPEETAEAADERDLPPGWSMERARGGLVFTGPPVDPEGPVTVGLGLGERPAPKEVGVEVSCDGAVVHRGTETVRELPPLTTVTALEEVALLPPAVSSGQEVTFRPLDPARTPAHGSWSISGEPAQPVADGSPEIPLQQFTVPPGWSPGTALQVTYTDLWGELLVDARAGTKVVPPPADVPDSATITDATPMVLTGGTLCVCGWFPTAAARSGMTLDGEPLGEPTCATPEVLQFALDPATPTGEVLVEGATEAGFDADDRASSAVVSVGGSIDRDRLMRGESTPLHLWVEGTREPVTMTLRNETPGIVSIEGGETQQVTTSGGEDNRLTRTVDAVSPGDFNISYTLEGSSCPCAEGSLPRVAGGDATDEESPQRTTADDAIDSFQRGRDLANEARDRFLFDEENPADKAQEALDEFGRTRELIEEGIENGSIGPELAKALDRFTTEYEEQAEGVLESEPDPELEPPSEPEPTPSEPESTPPDDDPWKIGGDYSLSSSTTISVGVDWTLTTDWTGEPDDEQPASTPEEEEDAGPVGIVLLRGQDAWIPRYQRSTFLIAKIYEPDPTRPGVWLPSDDRKRRITARFASRSNEPGKAVNADLPDGPQDSPDLYFYEKFMTFPVECTDDPTGRGHFGSCTTELPENRVNFYVRSDDYGSFSEVEAVCDDCVPLVVVGAYEPGGPLPPAVEESDRSKRLVDLPSDTNDNQIADYYPPERVEFMHAEEDSDDEPTGDGTEGDGYSAYEEYRGFIDEYGFHQRTDWSVKTLVVQNIHGFPTGLFSRQSGLELVEIDPDGHRDRIANYNGRHAHVTDQHALTLRRGVLPDGVAGRSFGFGPPRNVEKVVVKMGTAATSTLVAHELGHAVGMRHHGDVPWDTSTDPTSDEFKEEIRPMTDTWRDLLPGHVHPGTSLCGKTLPARFSIGVKGNQASGHAHCIMRYNYWKEAYEQAGGDFDCMPQGLARRLFCESPSGTGPNRGGRTADDASRGDCKGQIIVNDGS